MKYKYMTDETIRKDIVESVNLVDDSLFTGASGFRDLHIGVPALRSFCLFRKEGRILSVRVKVRLVWSWTFNPPVSPDFQYQFAIPVKKGRQAKVSIFYGHLEVFRSRLKMDLLELFNNCDCPFFKRDREEQCSQRYGTSFDLEDAIEIAGFLAQSNSRFRTFLPNSLPTGGLIFSYPPEVPHSDTYLSLNTAEQPLNPSSDGRNRLFRRPVGQLDEWEWADLPRLMDGGVSYAAGIVNTTTT
jgi:hypothetical protein